MAACWCSVPLLSQEEAFQLAPFDTKELYHGHWQFYGGAGGAIAPLAAGQFFFSFQ